MTETTFGQVVAEHRKRHGWSQEDLAEQSGLTTRAISAIEQGQVKDPRISTIRALGRVLGESFFTDAYRYNHNSGQNSSQEVPSA